MMLLIVEIGTSSYDAVEEGDGAEPVSYTHLDVYKRQVLTGPGHPFIVIAIILIITMQITLTYRLTEWKTNKRASCWIPMS